MKLKLNFITSALAASCFCLQAQGAPAVEMPPVYVEGTRKIPKANGDLYRQVESSTELIGLEVWNLQNEKLGKIKSITADLENARLVEVVVASGGGFFGVGGKTTSVLPRALKLDETGDVMRLDMSKARFDAASSSKTAGHVQTTESILGLQIHNTKGQYLGKVGSLMMDLPQGRIIQVVNVTQAMGGDNSYVIQPSALRYNTKRNGLVLDQSFAELKDEPHFKWVGSHNKAFQQEFANNAQNGTAGKAIAMGHGQNLRDAQKTSRIELAIKTNSSLSHHARNVKVATLNSQTTLRGHVNTAEGKRKIGVIAAEEGKPENVSNLLVVRALSGRTSSE
ncbi:PRC-barrel domain-containing protein [Prosthecobacter sp.]|uniref:PRC-barrel domain-containing protein n=1 Tax=Prosthecobacter sp. TaxID=1965333 RepID=UPI002ABA7521|nr:PRC-barrel domain-containing protein [Prosthecobacter sp.]MDZ4401768.1 PRC-barrel domain-containing protein [Prosthecobacter sp.]